MGRFVFVYLVLSFFLNNVLAEDYSNLPFPISNVVPPLDDDDDPRANFRRKPGSLPIKVAPFIEHRRHSLPAAAEKQPLVAVVVKGNIVQAKTDRGEIYQLEKKRHWTSLKPETALADFTKTDSLNIDLNGTRKTVRAGDTLWIATDHGLYHQSVSDNKPVRHESYGINGPLATDIRDMELDSKGRLWLATPVGLSLLESDGKWRAIRGREGLPFEDLTAIAIDPKNQLWIGTTHGLIHYRPDAKERQWFYRAGKRYLPNDTVNDVALSSDGNTVYTATQSGLGRLDLVTTTLLEKAETIERILNQRHRRLGLVASCTLKDPLQPDLGGTISDNDNDGLWTAYHVAAMSLAYAVTKDEAAKESARKGMHALYMLQDASGTPGLVARSVHTIEEGKRVGKDKLPQWRLTPDKTMYWKSDTSSDEIDGHYFAFYSYWEHVAQHDPAERKLCLDHIRAMTDYIIENGYLLIDWDGERTSWGYWSPELLNKRPAQYLDNGLNSLQILSFLKTAYHIMRDERYQKHYNILIHEHRYLSNILLEKKIFPDSNNHSDNQLSFVAWYPLLQTEQEPAIRHFLLKGIRRSYKCISLDRSSFFYFVAATINPDYVDIESAVTNLKRIPTDRRQWRMTNSHRADVVFDPRIDRFGQSQLIRVLPVDERNFGLWNANVYLPDAGSSGSHEDDGAAYLLPYWMGRYHGFIAETP